MTGPAVPTVSVQRRPLLDVQDLVVEYFVGGHTVHAVSGVSLQVARGEVEAGGETLGTSDGLAISGERSLTISGRNAEVLLFDLN